MIPRRSFEDHLADWLEEGPVDAPGWLLGTVLAAIPSIPQRRGAWRIPWRTQPMNGSARWVAVALVVAAITLGAVAFISRPVPGGVGGPASPSPSPSAPPSPTAQPSATPIDTATWTTFSSIRHGYAIKVPTGWTIQPASAPWLFGQAGDEANDPTVDQFAGPGHVGLVVASQKVPAGMSASQWFSAYLSGTPKNGCFPPRAQWASVTIAGQAGAVHGGLDGCGFTEAVAIVGGRAYVLTGYVSLSGLRPGIYDETLFDAFLSTVEFTPGSADDRPPVSPSPS